MKNNPDWQPYLKTLEKAAEHPKPHVPVAIFITSYPKRLQPVVALGLSLAKWYLRCQGVPLLRGMSNCGCCIYYSDRYMGCGGCENCSLIGKTLCVGGTDVQVYNRTLKAYTKAFKALPARDRQRKITKEK